MELVGKLMPGAAIFTTTGATTQGWSDFTSTVAQPWARLTSPTEVTLDAGKYLAVWLGPDGTITRLISTNSPGRADVARAGGSHIELITATQSTRLRLVGSHTDASLVVLRL